MNWRLLYLSACLLLLGACSIATDTYDVHVDCTDVETDPNYIGGTVGDGCSHGAPVPCYAIPASERAKIVRCRTYQEGE